MKATLSIHQLYAKPILFVVGLPLLLVVLPALMRRITGEWWAWCLPSLLIFHTFANKLPKFRYDYRKRCY
ncbi:hypothetical protein H6B13_00670 [Bacteroides gallinaceum]|uniref:hypothetical protein n=1 Tax=Bacteroides gallinaceum TaxID=1462571 RepID=UPI00195D8602|nr:hypothetical protein [Bacteroides gallinaceum]MBM6718160.1 hypothetical protein [Bacteroides gallinaceum]